MLQYDTLNVGKPMAHGWGRVVQAVHPGVNEAFSCNCGSFSFHLVRVDESPILSVICDACLSFIHKE